MTIEEKEQALEGLGFKKAAEGSWWADRGALSCHVEVDPDGSAEARYIVDRLAPLRDLLDAADRAQRIEEALADAGVTL